jgi:hypothetical protein
MRAFPDYDQQFGAPLQLYLYSKEQQNMLRDMKNFWKFIVLFLDATGSIIRNPICHKYKGKHVLYYAGVIK